MKKPSELVATVAVAAVTLAGCSSAGGSTTDQNDPDEQTLEIWQRKAPDSPSDMVGQEVAEAFTEATGTEVEFISILEDFETKLQQRAAQGDLPDVVINDTAQLGNMQSQGMLREIDRSSIEGADSVSERAWGAAEAVDGNYYGVPYTAHTVAVFNRADWRENVGAEVPQTWDDLLELWKAYADDDPTDTGEDVAGIALPGTTKRGYLSWNTSTFFWSGGGEYFEENADGTFRSAVATEGSVEAADWIRDLVCEHDVAQPGAGSQDTTNTKELFQTDGAGTYLVAPYELASFDLDPGADVVEVFAPPPGPAGLTTLAEGNNVYLMAGSENESAQEAFAEWAISVEGQTVGMAGDEDGNIVRLPVNQDVVMSDVRTDDRWSLFQELYDENGRYVPGVPNWAPFLNASAETLNALISDCTLDTRTAMEELDDEFNRELESQGVLAE
ncbi:sugar ABC transporter substrate-binding protein [Phytoactinopolyspora endophytica]|uniref:sugar ABC transporter substrate-binding protein n=1 Tax=Phytoactinopolyspora endophytica TaxID=1642495 RepID=UPI0013ED4DA2|nr:extracellular solute-binding protein [Phytoactinopolyspora endophytica]